MTADVPATSEETTKQRNRRHYTTVACDKCRKRKSKCSGGQPCDRCREHKITCSYPRTTRFRSARQNSAVASSVMGVDAVNPVSQQRDLANEVSSDCSAASSAALRPENFDYYIRLVENNFGAASADPIRKPTGKSAANFMGIDQIRQAIECRAVGSQGGALAAFDLETWIAVLQLWDEEVGLQYPLLNIHQLVSEIDAAKQDSSPKTSPGSSHQYAADTAFLILAILFSIKDTSAVEVADPVVQEIYGVALVQVHTGRIQRGSLVLLILTAVYSFLVDREVLAWRTTGTVLRLLQELDCHDSKNYDVDIDDKFFWAVYTLDRRWSFGTGLSFAVSDTDIIRNSKLDDGNLSLAYLSQMISYCNIASDVRKSLFNSSPTVASSSSTRDFLEFRVLQWQQNLPTRLQFHGSSDIFDSSKETRGEYKLRLMLYLRANQMRIVIHRKFATRLESDTHDPPITRNMIEVARGTIHVLLSIARETDIYYAQHKTFNHFLETALSSLLLILCSPKASQHPSCLKDVLMAMEFIGQLAKKSPISERLKNKLQGIQQLIVEANRESLGPSHVHTTTRDSITSEGPSQRNNAVPSVRSGPSESAFQPRRSEQEEVLTNPFNSNPAVHQLLLHQTRSRAMLDTQTDTTVPTSGPKPFQPAWLAYESPSNLFVSSNPSGSPPTQGVAFESVPGLEKVWPLSSTDASGSTEIGFTSEDLAVFRSADMAEILKDYDSFFF